MTIYNIDWIKVDFYSKRMKILQTMKKPIFSFLLLFEIETYEIQKENRTYKPEIRVKKSLLLTQRSEDLICTVINRCSSQSVKAGTRLSRNFPHHQLIESWMLLFLSIEFDLARSWLTIKGVLFL